MSENVGAVNNLQAKLKLTPTAGWGCNKLLILLNLSSSSHVLSFAFFGDSFHALLRDGCEERRLFVPLKSNFEFYCGILLFR